MRPLPLLLLAAFGVGLATLGGVVLHPDTTVPLVRFAEGQFINLALGARELPWPRHTGLLGWPSGAGFAPLLWPWLPVARLAGPTLALNGLFLLFPVFNAGVGYVCARRFGLAPWPAFAAGGLLAWNAWVFNTTANGQLEQVPIAAAAWIWASAWETFGSPRPSRIAGTGLVVLGVGLAAPHVGLAALVGLVALVPLRLAERGISDRSSWSAARLLPIGATLLTIGIAAALVHAWHAPQFGDTVNVFAPKGAVTSDVAEPALAGVFEVATTARLLEPPDPPAPQAQGVAHCAYLGWVTLLAALAAGRRPPAQRGIAPVGLAIATVLIVASLGEYVDVGPLRLPLPAAAYGALSDALSRSANPYRLVSGAVVALSLAAASVVRGPRTAVVLVAAAWVEVLVTRTRGVPLAHQAWGPLPSTLALRGGTGPILDLPLASPRCPDVGWHYATEAMWHGRPVPLTLRFDWRAWGALEPLAHQLQGALGAPTCAQALPALVHKGGFTAVVLHGEARCPVDPGTRPCLEAAFGAPSSEGTVAWWSVP